VCSVLVTLRKLEMVAAPLLEMEVVAEGAASHVAGRWPAAQPPRPPEHWSSARQKANVIPVMFVHCAWLRRRSSRTPLLS
jgi:hypothetical protein